MRNSSLTELNAKSGTVRSSVGELDRGQRLEPQRATTLQRHATGGERPRCRFEDVPVPRVAMGEGMLEIVGERPHLTLLDEQNRGSGDDLILVVNQLGDGVFNIADPCLEQHVAPADALIGRHVFDEDHDAPAERRLKQVVEILDGARAQPRVRRSQRRPHGVDVLGRVQHAEQPEHPIHGALPFLGERLGQQGRAIQTVADKQVVMQRHRPEGARRFLEDLPLDDRAVDGQLGCRSPKPLDGSDGFEANEAVIVR